MDADDGYIIAKVVLIKKLVKNRDGQTEMEKQKVTWRTTGVWTLLTLFLSILAGIILMGRRVFLTPPIAAYTIYFYLGVVLLPALVVFVVFARRRPTGSRMMLIALPIFASLMACFYFVLIGPAFYVDIQCQSQEQMGLIVHLDCQCEYNTSGGKAQVACVADQIKPIPLMWLIEENR